MIENEFDLVYLAAAMLLTMVLPIVIGLVAVFQER
jgi:uncharacterized membrane protein